MSRLKLLVPGNKSLIQHLLTPSQCINFWWFNNGTEISPILCNVEKKDYVLI